MTLVSGENITKQFDNRIIFDNLTFSVNEGDRIGLVGPNGIGKTTLFDMIAGIERVDSGHAVKSKECNIGYVKQEFGEDENLNLFDFVCSARDDLLKIRSELDRIEHDLESNPQSPELLDKLGDLQHKFEDMGGYEYEAEIKIILVGLGFHENRFHNSLGNFSGGEKNRAALAKILAGKANLLLLDEPTNHLDIDSTIWLEEYLGGLDIAYIIVSHDRTFLNNTIKKVWEITGKKIEQYYGGFDNYLKERIDRREQLLHKYKHQQEEIRRIEDFIRRNMAGQKTKQAQSKEKYLKRMNRIELDKSEKNSPTFRVESSGRSFNLILSLNSATFGYGNHALVKDADFNLYRGDKVGFVGKNGSGKSTILRTILGELEPLDGEIKIGKNVDYAYFDQELSDLNDNNTVIDELWQVDLSSEAGTLRSFLARFGFVGEDAFKPVRVLSGGEKTKLALAKILYKPANFLIFDEPTNHLDIDARQALEEALENYDGAYVIVSHDRYFLDRIAERILAVEDNRIRVYDGNYSFYREKALERREMVPDKKIDPGKKEQYYNFKEQSKIRGRIKKEIQSVKSKISDSEKKLSKLEEDLSHNIPKNNWEELARASEEKSKTEDLLLELYNRLEELEELDAENFDS